MEQVYLFFKLAKNPIFSQLIFTMRLGVKEPLGMALIPSLESQHQSLIKQAQPSLLPNSEGHLPIFQGDIPTGKKEIQ